MHWQRLKIFRSWAGASKVDRTLLLPGSVNLVELHWWHLAIRSSRILAPEACF
ncbi:hypothetical protein M758_3G211700 [Ceratodon purpureus]|uniref:Uncharacterized protein n=1 Tax=Ceratodon purpureus TaxID=3225 RepID=A0A8T0INQ4_CERPU|nr:hypothetical protein KC19_3G211600 [Ceratodon purpureus]KAG0623926.1 hypothetical protein M758_3G211700 [Ceratodon purpureus]